MGKKLSRGYWKKLVAMVVMVAMIMSNLISTVLFAYDGDFSIDQGLSISLRPVDKEGNLRDEVSYEVGEEAIFRLSVTGADPNLMTSSVKIKLPEELKDAVGGGLRGLSAPGSTITSNNVTISLTEDNNKNRYIEFSISQGQTFSRDFTVQYANGTTKPIPLSLSVAESDIEIVNQIGGNTIKKVGGTLKFTAGFSWEDVTNAAVTPAANVQNQKISNDIIFDIGAVSNNDTGIGDVYTDEYTLTDTITLPEHLSFPEGTVSQVYSGGKTQIKVGDTVVAEIDKEIEEGAAINGKTLTFAYKHTRTENTAGELTNPDLKVTLKANTIRADSQSINDYDGTLNILNKADFEAAPIYGDKHTSSRSVEVEVEKPENSFTIRKTSTKPYIEPGQTEIEYTIDVTSTSDFKISGMNITDGLPNTVEYIGGSATMEVKDSRGNTVTSSALDDSYFSGNKLNLTGQSIDIGHKIVIKFKAKVKEGLTSDTTIANMATATVGDVSKNSESAVNTYYTGTPKRTIRKNVTMENGKNPVDGQSARYSITIGNDSGVPMDFTVKDVLPEYIDPNTITDAKVTYYDKDNKRISYDDISYTKEVQDGSTLLTFSTIKGVGKATYSKAVISYSGTLRGINDALEAGDIKEGGQIINTAYIAEEPEKNASAILLVKERRPKLRPDKSAGNVEYVSENLYSIGYTIRLENKGDEFITSEDADKYTVTDIMGGDFVPDLPMKHQELLQELIQPVKRKKALLTAKRMKFLL